MPQWPWSRKPSNPNENSANIMLGSIPVLETITQASKFFDPDPNKYVWYERIYEWDPETAAAIDKLAVMARNSYRGPDSTKNKELDNLINMVCTSLDVPNLIESAASHLLRHGDDMYLIMRTDGLPWLQPLPIQTMTILDRPEDIGTVPSTTMPIQIWHRNVYVMNEMFTVYRKVWMAADIVHFSYSGKAEGVRDILNRYTYGVWSISPMESLRTYMLWKFTAIVNDIIWRSRNVPREHHKLDMGAYDPVNFVGSPQERMAAAKAAADAAIKAYAESIKGKSVDQGYITGKEVDIGYVEARGLTYNSPNKLLDQLTPSIVSRIGVPATQVGQRAATFASELVFAAQAGTVAENLANKIAGILEGVIKNELILRGYKPEDVEKVSLNIDLVLDTTKSDSVRQVALLAQTGVFTVDELRGMIGYDPVSPEDVLYKSPVQGREGQNSSTPGDQQRAAAQQVNPTTPPITPESRADKQIV